MLFVAILYFVLAAALGAFGAATLAGRLPRNRWLGLRTDATLRTDAAFRSAHRIAAPSQLGAAAVLALGAIGMLLVSGAVSLALGVAAPVIAFVLTALGLGTAQRVAAAAQPDDTGACGQACGACVLRDSCDAAVR